MKIEESLALAVADAFKSVFDHTVDPSEIDLQPTRKEFEGNLTFVVFPYLKISRKKPEETAQLLGEAVVQKSSLVSGFNVIKGFLNFSVDQGAWVKVIAQLAKDPSFGKHPANGKKVMVEYSSPNTNKPLHLGHLRNNFLGFAVSNLLEANGNQVLKANLVNDRGIHICKSMVAYQKFGEGEQPSEILKGDKLAGNYYVKFDQVYKEEVKALMKAALQENESLKEMDIWETKAELEKKGKHDSLGQEEKALLKEIKELVTKAEKEAPILLEAQETLRKWEKGDEGTVALWKKMNGWVYEGFEASYKLMGVSFDKYYYESDTYLLGKDIVEEGLEKKEFFKKEDGSVWINMEKEGLDEKLLLRADGTSVYMTQDMGTADLKYQDFPMDSSVYVVGNEQDYHFKVLKIIMTRLGRPYAEGIYHLSYGMVDLPSGKMKSREGTVVDADDLINEMIDTARVRTSELGKIDDFDTEEAEKLYRMLALGALKYYLLRVDAKKRILFNPEESIDFQGNTGVYIQYNHAKIRAIVRKAEAENIDFSPSAYEGLSDLADSEIEIARLISTYPDKLNEAAKEYQPALVANYAYELAKMYSKFYSELPIFNEKDPKKLAFRVSLSEQVARTLKLAMGILGIEMPEKM